MPSDTKPLPAAQLLALADAMVEATHAYNAFLHDASAKMAARILTDAEMMPIRDSIQRHADALADATEAYRAARAASPRSLEEFVLAEEYRTLSDTKRSAKEYRAAKMAREEHARRLAGEGSEN